MGLHPTLVAFEQILHGAVLGIGDHRFDGLSCVRFVAIDEVFQHNWNAV